MASSTGYATLADGSNNNLALNISSSPVQQGSGSGMNYSINNSKTCDCTVSKCSLIAGIIFGVAGFMTIEIGIVDDNREFVHIGMGLMLPSVILSLGSLFIKSGPGC